MTLSIYNTSTQKKQPFSPLEKNHIKLYVCGITTYDYLHVGHARVLVIFDVVTRYLRSLGYKVTYVRNITDIDDKIIQRAQSSKQDWKTLTEYFIRAMHEDESQLGIQRPDIEPKATEHIAQIIDMIQLLLDRGHAYVTDEGDIYYDISTFSDYGKLARQSIENLQAGIRVEINIAKRHALDFVLWKAAKPGEPYWPSPWGHGRPGWHIECSAMSTHYLGTPFDIHGGGIDLRFPHHQNETAQSEAAYGKPFVHTWMHAGHVRVNDTKMSKSLGNFHTLRDLLKQYHPEVLRYFLITSHYRSPINYSKDHVCQSKASLTRLYTALKDLPTSKKEPAIASWETLFREKMQDDFNTPEALAVLFEIAHQIHIYKQENDLESASELAQILRQLAEPLGLLQSDPQTFLQSGIDDKAILQKIESLIRQRERARAEKDWSRADQTRDQLSAMGVILEDTADGGTQWKKQDASS